MQIATEYKSNSPGYIVLQLQNQYPQICQNSIQDSYPYWALSMHREVVAMICTLPQAKHSRTQNEMLREVSNAVKVSQQGDQGPKLLTHLKSVDACRSSRANKWRQSSICPMRPQAPNSNGTTASQANQGNSNTCQHLETVCNSAVVRTPSCHNASEETCQTWFTNFHINPKP